MYNHIETIIKEADQMIHSSPIVEYHKPKDIVTNMDVEAERFIIESLKKLFPNDLFISEEENHEALTDHPTWIIDPIDGTLNFTRNIPQYGIQLARYINKQPVYAMIYAPVHELLIYGVKGKGCFVNHKGVELKTLPLEQSILTFGDFSRSQPSSRPKQLDLMNLWMDDVMKVRIYGASSTDFGYVIAQKSQCHVIFTKRIWELAAGLFLAEEAGLSIQPLHFEDCEGVMIGLPNVVESLYKKLNQ